MAEINIDLDRVCEFLEEREFPYTVDREAQFIRTSCRGANGAYEVAICIGKRSRIVNLLLCIPIQVPESRRLEMAETITRANWMMRMGCFEMDMSDGQLGFRNAISLGASLIDDDQLWHLLLGSCAMADSYNRAFLRLLYADDLSPAEAIAEVEFAQEDSSEDREP